MSNKNQLADIGKRIQAQDNFRTVDPIFHLQIKRRIMPLDHLYIDERCWHDFANKETVYDDDPHFKEPKGEEWSGPFGYIDIWETVTMAFTRKGLEDYMELDGHNVRHRAFRGECRIYVDTLRRNPEMIAIREALIQMAPKSEEVAE